jgi:uncharacterized protein YrrD
MLQNIKDLYGNTLSATDGEIGKVKDCYFDERAWAVRYLVADTGSWLVDNLVLLSPHSFGKWDRDEKTLQINLTRQQIENSPPISKHTPLSRQYEEEYYRYYGWGNYWQGAGLWGAAAYPMTAFAPVPVEMPVTIPVETEARHDHRNRADRHLLSMRDTMGYALQATDGEIGSVTGFMMDDKTWAVGELIVETGHWYSGKEVYIKPGNIRLIDYEDGKIAVNLTLADIKHTAEHGVVERG